MYVELRRLAAAMALILAAGIASATPAYSLAADATPTAKEPLPANRADARDLETRMAETLEANPGSIKLDENVILLDPGITMTLPLDGEMSALSLEECARGWLCGWVHANFEGPVVGVQRCTYINLYDWRFWDVELGRFDDFALDISSVYNNLDGVAFAAWASWKGGNLLASHGDPIPYVGEHWNDSFEAAWGC